MFTLYSADITGNPGNCSYPHKHDVVDETSLKAAICHDYVCAEYKNNYRNTVLPRSFSAESAGSFTAAFTGTTEAASPSSGAAVHGLKPPATPATAGRSTKRFWNR